MKQWKAGLVLLFVSSYPGQQFWMVKEMLFRPSFCANCGEKIDRADWGILTSRRFCQVCESEFKGQDLIPRFIVGFALLIGVFGFGGYLKSGSVASESQLLRQPKKLVDQLAATDQAPKLEKTATTVGNTNFTVPPISEIPNKATGSRTDARMQEPLRPPRMQADLVEEVYFCGASTAKGTPCKHRVKGNVRCFQHVGMPALLPPNNLRIK